MNAVSATSLDRRDERTHLFVVATLYFGRTRTAVRVRNLSATGALVEGADLPPPGTEIFLRRGELEAVGTAVWAGFGKAGLSFSEPVAVSAWLPVKEAKRQTQVDQIAFGLKQEARAREVSAIPAVGDATMSMIAAVAELVALQADLSQLGETLAQDAALVVTHPQIQLLDSAGPRLAKIIEALRAQA